MSQIVGTVVSGPDSGAFKTYFLYVKNKIPKS